MNKKWLSTFLAGALFVTVTGTAFASSDTSQNHETGSVIESSTESNLDSGNQTGNTVENTGSPNNDGSTDTQTGGDGSNPDSHTVTNSEGQDKQQKHDTFNDIEEADWAAHYIMKMKEKGIIVGYPDGSFKPNQSANHSEVMTMMMRQYKASSGTNQSDSIPDSMKMDKQEKDAEMKATRLWVAQMAVRDLGFEAQAKEAQNIQLSFKDSADIPKDLLGYVKLAAEKGIFVGYPDGTFQPEKVITRAEMSVIMDRLDAAMKMEMDKKMKMDMDKNMTKKEMGSVVSTAEDNVTIKMHNGENKTIKLTSDTVVRLNNSPAKVHELHSGDTVEITLNADGQVVTIEATRNSQEASTSETKH